MGAEAVVLLLTLCGIGNGTGCSAHEMRVPTMEYCATLASKLLPDHKAVHYISVSLSCWPKDDPSKLKTWEPDGKGAREIRGAAGD